MVDKNKLEKIVENINKYAELMDEDSINIMEVCGTHTNSIARYGIRSIISSKINLISGPGCPVCVTDENYIDGATYLASKDITILTFGDLMKVSGNNGSLTYKKSQGRDIRIIYSLNEVINIAKEVYPKDVVFLAVGFETTAPLIASLIKQASIEKIENLYFLTSIKIMPPILMKILNAKDKKLHGIICPGNVATITGEKDFKFIYEKYKIPAVICGFQGEEILGGIYFLLKSIYEKSKKVPYHGFENLYKKWVSYDGNKRAKSLMNKVFIIEGVAWRGIGRIENSALVINGKYDHLDAINKFNLKDHFKNKDTIFKNKSGCRCSDVLLGNIYPFQCAFFGERCNPETPCGPCMISTEGACAAYYKYKMVVM
ncbi:hydrogenase formation protein HypD [uncultured Clostridium sp.]|uniref:hydrogenase formation protein HypD n=1 Tax=uncultured Clostridium sp. TaxID=59620 RepID=UPI0028EDEEB0|nr:hydrogenase formation protein HypD [uncultured Clostridium sp.]